MTLLIISVILNIIPIIILPLFYNNIPDNIPAYVDFMGNTLIAVEKTNFTILRLPMMGALFSMICIIMYSINLPEEKQKYNKVIWSVVALIGSLKMGITSAEIYFYENIEFVKIFRIVVFVLSGAGIIVLLYGVFKICKSKVKMVDYKDGINKIKVIIIGVLFIAYIVITVLPVYKYLI